VTIASVPFSIYVAAWLNGTVGVAKNEKIDGLDKREWAIACSCRLLTVVAPVSSR
jgi:hypothetical protein